MARIRHQRASQERRKAAGQFFVKPSESPLKPLAEGQVRCDVCEQPAHLTSRGNLRPHPALGGEPCPNRTHETPVEFDRELAEQMRLEADRPLVRAPETGVRLSPRGTCYGCERPVSGERTYCGQCLRRRFS